MVSDMDYCIPDTVSGASSELFRDELSKLVTEVVDTDTQISSKLRIVHDQHNFDWFFDTFNMYIDPDLPEILASPTPPPIEWFESLPNLLEIDTKVLKSHYIVYGLIMEKDGHKSRLSVGSAATQEEGAAVRTKDYRKNIVMMFSKYTKQSLDEGFEIAYIGVIIAIQKPETQLRPLGRAWTLSLEASCTWKFWTPWRGVNSDHEFHYMRHVCSWELVDLDWDGLNSHSPLSEHVGSIELTEEELIRMQHERRQKLQTYKNSFARKRYAEDPDVRAKIKARGHVYEKEYGQREPVKARRKARYLDAKADGRYRERADRNNEKMRASQTLLKAVQAGEIENDEDVEKEIAPALKKKATRKAWRANNMDKEKAHSDKRNVLEKECTAALRDFEAGLLDDDDEDVQKMIQRALKKRENGRKRQQKYRAKKASL